MKIKKKYLGSSIHCQSVDRVVKIEDKNAMILHRNNHLHLFDGNADLKPIEKVESSPDEIKDEDKLDVSRLLSKISTEALNDFDGRSTKDIKSDLDALEIEYPAKAGKKALAEIVKNLDA